MTRYAINPASRHMRRACDGCDDPYLPETMEVFVEEEGSQPTGVLAPCGGMIMRLPEPIGFYARHRE